MKYPFDTPAVFVSSAVSNVYEGGRYTEAQAVDKATGLPLWSVLLEVEAGGMRPDRLRVTVASETDPGDGLSRGDRVELVGGAVSWWSFKDGRTVVKVTADGLASVA